jgi:hypothetical protein
LTGVHISSKLIALDCPTSLSKNVNLQAMACHKLPLVLGLAILGKPRLRTISEMVIPSDFQHLPSDGTLNC